MTEELEKRLVDTYPTMFQEYGGDMRDTCMHWGCACGDGWFSVLWALCHTIEGHYKGLEQMGKPLPEPVVFEQIKEKYGTLTVYYRGGDEAVRNYVDMAGVVSMVTCEDCGSTVDPMRQSGYIRHICRVCAQQAVIDGRKDGMGSFTEVC